MPYLMIQTNQPVGHGAGKDLMDKASARVAELLGKPERYVMVGLHAGVPMVFGGSDDPAVYMELKSIGLPANRTAELSEALAEFARQELAVGRERVYIEFADAERRMWGWNGATF